MKKIDNFTNLYSLQKTLRFKLIPMGKTKENFDTNNMLAEDKHRAESYDHVKQTLDLYYKAYIDRVLPSVKLCGLTEYAELYYKPNKTAAENKKMKDKEKELRKQISAEFTKDDMYSRLFKKEAILDLPDFINNANLPDDVDKEDEKERAEEFFKFTTYFSGFFENRKNMFTAEEKSTGIAYRCINDNLPRFLDNVKNFAKIKAAIPDVVESINTEFQYLFSVRAEDLFCIDGFNYALCQADIDKYNQVIGGYGNSDKTKIQGLNERINLYNQQVESKKEKLPELKRLYKQILSEKSTVSFIPEKLKDDDDVLNEIKAFFEDWNVNAATERINEIFCKLDANDVSGIYVKNGNALTEVSKSVFDSWDTVLRAWEREYDNAKGYKDSETYIKTRAKAYKAIESFSVAEIDRLGNMNKDDDKENKAVIEWAVKKAADLTNAVAENYNKEKNFISAKYNENIKLCANNKKIEELKNLLDSVKLLESFLKLFIGTGKEGNKNDAFYGALLSCWDAITKIDDLYDKVRNYVTQKPFSKEKIKLNFDCSSFLNGWATEYSSNGAVIFEKDGLYYIGIIDKKFTDKEVEFICENADGNSAYRIVYDFQKSDNKNPPRLFIRSKGENYSPAVKKYGLPINDIIEIYDKGHFKTETKNSNPELYKESLVKLIDYFKLGFSRHESYCHYDFKWKASEEYNNISEFYGDVGKSCYVLKKEKINFDNLLKLVDENRIYLFQIYNKDFSPFSHGNESLHTMYFKALFSEQNMKDTVFKLNGKAEMFYREKSVKYSDEIMEKGHHYDALKDKFSYPIIKDRRYTQDQFMLHIPITINFGAEESTLINNRVRTALKNSEDNYIIGIDRGERNLIYICVIDGNGQIIKQYSLNDIVNEYKGNAYHTDYHRLLDEKERDRLDARKNWTAIENIKDLKEGYISQVVHKICELVEEYDAVIAMEDLNSGFKNARSAVEKSVYQKFEKMLIDKLNFYVNKKTDASLPGGIYSAYQLTEKFDSFKKMGKQNGFIFYIPAWLTSKIDPTTGFVDMLYPKYEKVETAKEFFEKFKRIAYNPEKDYFEFDFDYTDFGLGNTDYRKCWTICTFGERIETFKNKDKNSEWDNRSVNLTEEFKCLFEKHGIGINGDIKQEIIKCPESKFYKELVRLLKLTLQMRNSRTGTDEDYLISPVMNDSGQFYDSRNYSGENAPLPVDADANGAYHIAKKAMWAIEQIKQCSEEESGKGNLSISKAEWLAYVQKR